MNQESVNGTHTRALLAAHRCNSDVQLPYRFPIIAETHCCSDPKCIDTKDSTTIEAAQIAQDAQGGHACDYCTKQQPMAFNEVKESCKGHQNVSAKL